MKANEAIFSRRSIRKYAKQKISNELVKLLLKAGMYAPSARNTQAWQFIVVQNRTALDELSEIHPYGKMLKDAALAILVCGDKSIENMDSYLIQNCSAATQNILLAAHANALGAVWLGVHPREERMSGIINYFKLPEHILPISLISIGYPNETKEKVERFKTDKIHFEKW